MKLSTRTVGAATVLEPLGSIDGRGAIEFEQKLIELVGGGEPAGPPKDAKAAKEAAAAKDAPKVPKEPPQIVIDFSGTEVLSGAGLRVLVTISNRIAHQRGAMCLCGMSEHLQNVFEVAGLANHFRTAAKVDAAVADLAALKANQKTPEQQARVVTALTDRAILLLEYESSDQPLDPTIVRRAIYASRGKKNVGPVATYVGELLDPASASASESE
jgi:anti-anti-sigma factor